MLLVFGIPAYIFVGGLGLIWAGRRLIDAPRGVWGFWTYSGLLVSFFISLGIFFYVGYWLWQVIKKTKP